jgi:Ca2+-transporting ATPase
VEEDRITFDNLRKATFYLLSVGLAGIVALLASLVLRGLLILLPAQILWLNMVVDGFQDVAMGFESGEKDVLDRPPRRPEERMVSRVLWEPIVISTLVMAAGALLMMFRWELNESGSLEQPRTAALTTLGIFSAFHVGNTRSARGSAFSRSPFSNPFTLFAVALAMAMHVGGHVLPTSPAHAASGALGPRGLGPYDGCRRQHSPVVEVHKLPRRDRDRRASAALGPGASSWGAVGAASCLASISPFISTGWMLQLK